MCCYCWLSTNVHCSRSKLIANYCHCLVVVLFSLPSYQGCNINKGVVVAANLFFNKKKKKSIIVPITFEATLYKDLLLWLAKNEGFHPSNPIFFNPRQVHQAPKQKERQLLIKDANGRWITANEDEQSKDQLRDNLKFYQHHPHVDQWLFLEVQLSWLLFQPKLNSPKTYQNNFCSQTKCTKPLYLHLHM